MSRPPPRRRTLEAAVVAALYLVLACLEFWPVGPLDTTHIVQCACSDQAQETWFLDWTAFALLHGHNPLFTTYLMAPRGANLAVDTSMPLLGLLATPVTATLGPVAAYNLMLRLAFAVSGLSMYLLLRRHTTWWPAAVAGGLLYGFSPYLVAQNHGHLFLTFVPIPPLMVAVVDDWLGRRTRSPTRSGLLLGVLAGLQYLISPEVLAITGVALAAGLTWLALTHPGSVRERLPALLSGGAIALGLLALLAGYPVWMLLEGPRHVIGPPHAVFRLEVYRNPIAALVVPTQNQLIYPPAAARLANPYVLQDGAETGAYLGIPLVALLVVLGLRCRREGLVAGAAAGGVTAYVLSLGSRLELGPRVTHVPLPFALLVHTPLLQNIEPARFSLVVQLAAALILGVGLDRVRTGGLRARRALHRPSPPGTRAGQLPTRRRPGQGGVVPVLLIALAALALTPLLPRLPYPSVSTDLPEFFTSPAVAAIPRGAIVLPFPWDARPNDDAMLWQEAAGMRFRILGGDVSVPGLGGVSVDAVAPGRSAPVRALLLAGSSYYRGADPPDSAVTQASLRRLIVTRSVAVVLVLKTAVGSSALVKVLTRVLGRPALHGDIDLWLVRALR